MLYASDGMFHSVQTNGERLERCIFGSYPSNETKQPFSLLFSTSVCSYFFLVETLCRMNCKRKATVLVVMLLLDFCHGHPTPPSASHQPPSSDQQPVLDNDDDDTSGNTDQQASIAKEDLSVLNDFFNENGVYFRGANKTFCGEAGEQKFYKSIKSTPVAGELYGVLSGVILALEGCTEESAIRLAELEISFNSNPVLIHAVNKMINALENEENQLAAGYAKLTTDEVKENQAEGRNTEQDAVMVLMQMLESQENQTESTYQADDEEDFILDENFTNAIQGNIKNITTELQILESVLPEEKQLGIVECRWRTGSENATETCFLASVNKEHFHWNQAISKDEYGRILEAKLACEKWGSECVGFSTRQNIPFYYLLKECSNLGIALPSNRITDPLFHFLNSTTTPPSDGNGTTYLWPDSSNENITTELWFKDCSRNQNSDANNTTFTRRPSHVISHVGRRDAESDASVTVYEHINYAGASIILTGAVDTIDQAWNNKISSLRFPERDWSVVAFEDPNFLGRQAAFIGDTSFVGSEMNDRISSMIVLPYRLDQLCFSVYEHANFQGRHQRLCGDHDFTSGSNWNKMISSLRVESQECGLILYDRSYDGKFKMFNGNVPYVGNEWNDKTSSIQIRPWILENHEGQIQPITIFYADAHYQGQSTAVKGTTDYIGRRMNDKVSSVKCDGECALLVFEHSNYEGQSRLYDGSQRDLSNFNDKLSSALVLMNRICVTLYEHSNYRGHSRQDCSDVDVFPSDWNDRVSSLTVDCTYCSVILYEHGSYQGDYKAFTGKVPYVGGHWNDLISSLQIRPWKLQNYERKTEKSCVDPGEKKAYNVIQWIPLISTLYSLGTSIYYGATGCHSAARERAVDLALDVVMDVATIATGGAAGAAAYGIKTGVKGGVKIGLHAAKKALTSTIKNSVKKGLKSGVKIASRGITGNVKSLGKSVIRSAKGIANAAKNLPGAVKAGINDVGRGLTKVSHQSIGKTAKEGATKLKNTLQRSFDDLADSAKRQVDEVGTASKSGKTNVNLCRRKRMINAPHCSKTELPQRHLNAQARALSESRREQAQNFFNEFKGSPSFKILLIHRSSI